MNTAAQPRFHLLAVTRIERRAGDCVVVEFEVPPELRGAYAYSAGQYVVVRRLDDDATNSRSYSLCDEVGTGRLRLGIKRHDGGDFSTYAFEHLAPGRCLAVSEPAGRFTPALDPAQARTYAAVAAGSGITPILSIVATTLAVEQRSHFRLHYGNRTVDTIMFREELDALVQRFDGRLEVLHYLSRESRDEAGFRTGRLDPAALCASDAEEWFLCGPKALLIDAVAQLRGQGLKAAQLHVELFKPAARPAPAANVSSEASMQPESASSSRELA